MGRNLLEIYYNIYEMALEEIEILSKVSESMIPAFELLVFLKEIEYVRFDQCIFFVSIFLINL